MSLSLKFIGAAKTVTGSKTLLSYEWEKEKVKVLVDCGLFQGPKRFRQLNWNIFPHAKDINAIVLTHAHLDHCGYIPKLFKEGFRGPIYCTMATKELTEIILKDSAKLQEEDAEYANRTKHSKHTPALPLYTHEDVEACLQYFEPVDRHQWVSISHSFSFKFFRAGHILGSSFVQFSYNCQEGCKQLIFSGDLGQNRSFVIKGPDLFPSSETLVLESTYGATNMPKNNIKTAFKNIINDTYNKNGVIVIPAFSVGRSQEILYLLGLLEREKLIPCMDVYLDGPMSIDATNIYSKYIDELKLDQIGNNLIPSLKTTKFTTTKDVSSSKALISKPGPFIVISSAGMLTGGRVLHHLKARLPDKNSCVIFVGHQAPETKGRLLIEGISSLRIHHEEIAVNASIHNFEGLSAHAYADEIISWVSSHSLKPKRIILNHGEIDSLNALQKRLIEELHIEEVLIADSEEQYKI